MASFKQFLMHSSVVFFFIGAYMYNKSLNEIGDDRDREKKIAAEKFFNYLSARNIMDKTDCADYDPISRILKRQSERKKAEEKNSIDSSNVGELEQFIEDFNEKQKEIEKEFEVSETLEQDKLYLHFSKLNGLIQDLQKFYSNATIFLRIYDKKICQNTLQTLQGKLKDLENRLLPKKKFGFKTRKNKVETADVKNGIKKATSLRKNDLLEKDGICGFWKRENEVLILKAEEIEKKDVLLSEMKNSCVKLFGNPSALHITNLENCQVYSGPVTTSVFVEGLKNSSLHVACQQLRIHETTNTDFFVHVTSKAIIEDSKDVRFGIYKLKYDGIDEHYMSSGLNRNVNNWDNVDDFNWLAIDTPSPNWSKLLI